MAVLRLLGNMNISPKTITALQGHGWDIVRVSDLLPVHAPDADILELARRENRVVVTQDLDFSALVALAGLNQPSLVTLRLSDSDPDRVTERLQTVLPKIEDRLQQGCAATVEDTAVRIRAEHFDCAWYKGGTKVWCRRCGRKRWS